MPFEDVFPFRDRPADERYEHERAPTGDVVPRGEQREDAPPSGFEGHRAVYRLAFKGMEVPGLPDEFRIGGARISQGHGPIATQRTTIVQKPGMRPVFEKSMEYVLLGHGLPLTVCEIDVEIGADLSRQMNEWRDQALAAVGLAVGLFDERLAQIEIAEDVVIYDEAGADPVAAIDHVPRLRTFQSLNRVLEEHCRVLEHLRGQVDLAAEDPALAAARWYLRGAQLGPTADAIVYFWIALEALSKPRWGTQLSAEEQRRGDVRWVELAVEEAGLNPADVDPPVGRLAGLRAEIVHGGVEQPELLHPGYYALEILVRLLLRHRHAMGEFGWPIGPNQSNVGDPWRSVVERLHEAPQTVWVGREPEKRIE